jgi:hypothetical protein
MEGGGPEGGPDHDDHDDPPDLMDAETRERIFASMQSACLQGDVLSAMLAECIDSDGDDNKPKRQRNQFKRTTSDEYRRSTWWDLYLADATTRDPRSHMGVKFRTGFRVPFSLFDTLMALARGPLEFSDSEQDATGRSVAPLELKVSMDC